jgi:hypothetical protein
MNMLLAYIDNKNIMAVTCAATAVVPEKQSRTIVRQNKQKSRVSKCH